MGRSWRVIVIVKFIEITAFETNSKKLINPLYIQAIDRNCVHCFGGLTYTCAESYEDIIAKLKAVECEID